MVHKPHSVNTSGLYVGPRAGPYAVTDVPSCPLGRTAPIWFHFTPRIARAKARRSVSCGACRRLWRDCQKAIAVLSAARIGAASRSGHLFIWAGLQAELSLRRIFDSLQSITTVPLTIVFVKPRLKFVPIPLFVIVHSQKVSPLGRGFPIRFHATPPARMTASSNLRVP